MAQLSHPYMTTGETIALTRWTFVAKVMSLLFNMLSQFFMAFRSRRKCVLITWLQSSIVFWTPKKAEHGRIDPFFLFFFGPSSEL